MPRRDPLDGLTRLPVDVRLRRILLVDDDNIARRAALELLQQFHFNEVREATNGEEALAMLAHTDFPIDLLITDIGMPVLNGVEMIEKIRMGVRVPDAKLPIIVLSDMPDSETLLRLKRLAINGYVAKPASPRDFYDRILAALKSARPLKEGSSPGIRRLT